jgi:predicted MFS family arabinose efflux permease
LNDVLRRPRLTATWTNFSYLALWGYLLYGVGTATPYLRADLGLTGFEAGLHASALAVGVLVAGLTADSVAQKIGANRLLDLAVVDLIAAIVLVAVAPALPFSLAGALLIGLGGASLGTPINVWLGRSGGTKGRRLMAQANAWAMVTAAAAPLAIGIAAAQLHAWRIGLFLPIVGFLLLWVLRPHEADAPAPPRGPKTSLPASYWFVWAFIVIGVAIEFSFVYWGSTVVSHKTGISSAGATVLASLFVLGMFVGRAAIGSGFGAGRGIRVLMAAGLGLICVGGSLIWVSSDQAVSGLGLLVGGLGTAGMWPLGVTLALQDAPGAQLQAAARATLASGVAVLVAPSALGLIGDGIGVVSAWPAIMMMAVTGLVLLAVAPTASAAVPPDLTPPASALT